MKGGLDQYGFGRLIFASQKKCGTERAKMVVHLYAIYSLDL